MKKADKLSRINGVQAGELEIKILGGSQITLKFAYCNVEDKATFGFGTKVDSWSEETMKRLTSLLDSMEEDVIKEIFMGESIVTEESKLEIPNIESL